jgi:hypothetical protein
MHKKHKRHKIGLAESTNKDSHKAKLSSFVPFVIFVPFVASFGVSGSVRGCGRLCE